jgi:hypothetical protein
VTLFIAPVPLPRPIELEHDGIVNQALITVPSIGGDVEDFAFLARVNQDMLHPIGPRIGEAADQENPPDEEQAVSLVLVAVPCNRNMGFEVNDVRIAIGVREHIPIEHPALVHMVSHANRIVTDLG